MEVETLRAEKALGCSDMDDPFRVYSHDIQAFSPSRHRSCSSCQFMRLLTSEELSGLVSALQGSVKG